MGVGVQGVSVGARQKTHIFADLHECLMVASLCAN